METFFLFCFLFGAVFTAVSVLLGFAGPLSIHIPGGHGGSTAVSHVGAGHVAPSHAHSSVNHAGSHTGDQTQSNAPLPLHVHLPVFNPSALLAFTTCFGATGYILTRFASWPVLIATPVAIVPGLLADLLIAFIIAKLVAADSGMRSVDYELEGTLCRVTITIPANGVGEVIFSKGGTRRSEAARSLTATAIPYNTEVVIVEYDHGTAQVQPYDEFVGRHERGVSAIEDSSSATRS